MSDIKQESLSDKTIWGMQQVIDRALRYVQGFEKTVVTGAVRALYPRVESRIRQTSEEELRTELRYLHGLLESILDEPSKKQLKSKPKRRRKSH